VSRRPLSSSPSSFVALSLARFAGGFGFGTLATLLPKHVEALDPSATMVFGVTVSAGVIIGLFTTGFTLASGVAVIPVARSRSTGRTASRSGRCRSPPGRR
jgi:hypothetical protein